MELFRQIFDRALIDTLKTDTLRRYGGLDQDALAQAGSRVGHERYLFSLPLEGPWLDPRVFANPRVLRRLKRHLGPKYVINSLSVVIAYPGAEPQHVHTDHVPLFEDTALSKRLPPHAFALIIPLVDLDPEGGGTTQYWPESAMKAVPAELMQKTPPSLLELSAGDAALMDYRVLHGGTPNRSALPRPILYIVYSRPWFRDAKNFKKHPPINISEDALEHVLETHPELFAYARWLKTSRIDRDSRESPFRSP